MPSKGPAAFLGAPLSADYRPSVANWSSAPGHLAGMFAWGDIEAMRRDPQVQFGLRVLRAPIHTATLTIEADGPEIKSYVEKQFRRFWRRDLNKALKMMEYGHAAGEPIWKADSENIIHYDKLKDFFPRDAKAIQRQGELIGVRVGNRINLHPPRCFWVANEPEYGSFYGQSRFLGIWAPYTEKTGRHGALASRRLWYVKNAFRGGTIRHPPGMIEDEFGSLRSCKDYAREILEKMETGGILVLPNARDPETKDYLWVYEPPQSNGDLRDIREYPKDLDLEILKGMGIPPEVVQASGESGSGYAGRSIPALVFWTSEDQIVDAVVEAFDAQIVRLGVAQNFGPGRKYEVEANSLAPKPQEMPGVGDQPSGPGGNPRPGNSTAPYQGPRGGQGAKDLRTGRVSYGLSLETPGVVINDELRNRVRRLAAKKFPGRNGTH